MKKISGFGEAKLARYGRVFLEEIVGHCQEQQIPSRMNMLRGKKRLKSNPTNRPSPTQHESLQLFKSGHSTDKIAELRGLKDTTIEGHLSSFVLTGELNVQELVSNDKIPEISNAILRQGDALLTPIKNDLGDDFTYAEIRAVVNHIKRGKSKQ